MKAKCCICGLDCNVSDDHISKRQIPTNCGGGCRSMYYRNIQDRKRINDFVDTGDIRFIKNIRIQRMLDLFPTMKIKLELVN